ncbi:PREDICTED: E3 ubiquitin-protein ligase Topors-like [Ceratosolen solmsi marchali]|uniref:E3 ubiquitin-protein ligase Topors n=1 Tax=Ceratosolen solmsi marchali TaxID=326594 RepID=A0AAJ7DX70_9HYME|nr:PREDICTED: E3 ubiquitin-protein ligase Topors-like [Ceratosolen solmsi marchali]
MESLERKDVSTGTDEPIKLEEIAQSPDTSERSNNAASPPPNCSICLGKLINKSFTDSCLHQFCFTCLLQWSKIKTECPLCKQTFKSIIHNVRSEEDYDQYHVQYTSQVAATLDVTADIHISGQWDVAVGVGVPVRPFMYRTTMGANRRYGMLLNPEAVARREQIPSVPSQISNEERRRRSANPIDYRRTVYRHRIWSAPLPDAFGHYRESSAEYYRRHPAEINRLVPWLNRELQVLLNNRPHIAYVMSVITESVTQYNILSPEFRNVVRPFFGIHTDHFLHEFSNYARTNFDLVGYDQAINYIPNRGLSNDYVPRTISPTPSRSSSSSSDSDVRILNDSLDFPGLNSFSMPAAGSHIIDIPGPSTVGQAFRVQLPYTTSDVLTISSTSSSSDNECEVIGYVKPRHERTPEIIDLSSSEAEEMNTPLQFSETNNIQSEVVVPLKEENLPSTSSYDNGNRRTRRQSEDAVKAQMYEYLNTTSDSDSDANDSDYNPVNRRQCYKSSSKKASKVVLRKLRSRKHKKSTTCRRKRTRETRNRSSYSSFGSDNESPQREASNSRGNKKYLSKSSDDSDYEISTRKSKRSKKSKCSKKAKKRCNSSSWSSKSVYNSSYSSSSSIDSDSGEEHNNKRNKNRIKRDTVTTNSSRYSLEEPSTNDKCFSNNSNGETRGTSQRKCGKVFVGSDLSDYRRSESSRRSSSGSFDSRKNTERLQGVETNSRRCISDGDDNSSVYSGNVSTSYPKRKTSVKSTSSQGTNYSTDRSSTITMSASSTKSDASSINEHSVLSKASRDRYRSHKKHKESKKRRRSRS